MAPIESSLDMHQGRRRVRVFLFRIGDCLFIVSIGVLTTWIMHMAHELDWGFIPCMVVGMAAAMVAQMVLAWAVSPLLGSIETMVPSMVVGMMSPMSICTLHLLGYEVEPGGAAILGAMFGLGMFGFLAFYETKCRNSAPRFFMQK